VSWSISRCFVAGFERRGATLHVKTDAEINSGNSGGAACDERFELVGFPTETIGDASEGGRGKIGYVRPLWLVPAAWWERVGVRPPRGK
jgi:S1-C subfamily serine protease